MTDDLIERLRERKATWQDAIAVMETAADEIEQLRAAQFRSEKAEIAELRAANATMYIEIERLRGALLDALGDTTRAAPP